MGQTRPLFNLFLPFQTYITILLQINVKNVHPVYGDGIQTHDLQNFESPPITTRPGLPPKNCINLSRKSDPRKVLFAILQQQETVNISNWRHSCNENY